MHPGKVRDCGCQSALSRDEVGLCTRRNWVWAVRLVVRLPGRISWLSLSGSNLRSFWTRDTRGKEEAELPKLGAFGPLGLLIN
jgi:hypothetical protein